MVAAFLNSGSANTIGSRTMKLRRAWIPAALVALSTIAAPVSAGQDHEEIQRAAVPAGVIEHVMVIELENESFDRTFGPNSPAVYLNTVLLSQGELVNNYFATGHVSLDNYISQVSGQASTVSTNDDCINLATLTNPPLLGGFTDVTPGSDATDQASFPGQVVGDGCVYPGPTRSTKGAGTIGDQLDAACGDDQGGPRGRVNWREYAEDMGNDPVRDYGTPDPLGGTTCAHPPIGGSDHSNSAAADDQYATRHNPFVYFHSVIDDQAHCDAHVVPLGAVTVSTTGGPDAFSGHLYDDLQNQNTTPAFIFVTPNLCNDGHDATCAGTNVEGGKVGGLAGADLWLKHWMPMIFSSPAYKSGKMLVVLTFDEGAVTDTRACPAANPADCHSPTGPNVSNPGFSTLLGLFGIQVPPTTTLVYPGGGQVGAVLFNKRFITPGTVNNTGVYNHYSALRSYEDILGIRNGGDDGHGHLGYAANPALQPFGSDVFNRKTNEGCGNN
jgi:phosphatidylinositol-3-phosphatase